MASKTQKTEKIRDRKSAPNKVNRKAEAKRLRGNIDVVQKLQGDKE